MSMRVCVAEWTRIRAADACVHEDACMHVVAQGSLLTITDMLMIIHVLSIICYYGFAGLDVDKMDYFVRDKRNTIDSGKLVSTHSPT